MSFDIERFRKAKFEPRRKIVEVPTMAPFFAEGAPAQWEVRGLNGNEMHRVAEATSRQETMLAAVKAMGTSAEKVAAFREVFGTGPEATPAAMANRIELLAVGSVEPKIDIQDAAKIADAFPVEFVMLTQAINELTGMGSDLVKPDAASQPTPA